MTVEPLRSPTSTRAAPQRHIAIYATCPQSKDHQPLSYARRAIEVAQWSEQYGCEGMLIYADNSLVDPWHVAHLVLQHTHRLMPLVAVQPIYMHPYTAAKAISTLAFLYGRRLALNMIAGGFRNDLLALHDPTPHDERYERLTEYTLIIRRLLSGAEPVTFHGRYYQVTNLKLTPPLPQELFPRLLISGSSDAGRAAARAIGATAVRYPKRPEEEVGQLDDPELDCGVRVGIIARETDEEAWAVAHERFPADRKGQLLHKLAMKASDSEWHRQLSERAAARAEGDPYWLWPFQNYKTFCPYLVGSYERVAALLAGYMKLGCRTFILDIPPSEIELQHTRVVFEEARELTWPD